MNSFLVNRCICHDTSFEEIKEHSEKNGFTTVKELQVEGLCITKCKMCAPYLELMLKTGETSFTPGEYLNRKEAG